VSVLAILLILIGVATLVLVVDWTFLVFASRRTEHTTDTLALSAVSELLDDGRLQDQPLNQSDDITDAETVITAPSVGLLAMNNAVLPSQLRVNDPGTELSIVPAHVENAGQPASGANYNTAPAGSDRYNTLRVEVFHGGANAVQLLMRGFGAPNTAKISGSSTATVDSRVVGYRPKAASFAPVAPFALSRTAWENTRSMSGTDSNGNGRKEYDFVLRYLSDPPGSGSMAVVNVDSAVVGSLPPQAILQSQIENGLEPADVNPTTKELGPFAPGAPDSLHAEDALSNSETAALVSSLQTVAASSHPLRVFPLYNTATFPNLDMTGFIAADILGAMVDSRGTETRILVRLEPAFVIHETAVTSYHDANSNVVPENDYCHKIRITR
jgi:hypothetical protein